MATKKTDKAVGKNQPANYRKLPSEMGNYLAGSGADNAADGRETWHWRTVDAEQSPLAAPRVPLQAERRGEIRK